MKESVEITITIKDSCISSLHETIASILDQTNLPDLNVTIFFDNHSKLPLDSEIAIIQKSPCKVSTQDPTHNTYSLHLDSGSVISRSFLYKGLHYLRHNPVAFVCPEFTFTRIDGTATISTICNDGKLINPSYNCLIDHRELSDSSQVRAKTIKSTCLILPTTQLPIKKYFKSTKTHPPTFDHPIFQPTKLTVTSSNHDSINPTTSKPRLSSLSRTILNTLPFFSRPKDHNYPAVYIDGPTRREIARLSDHMLSFKGYESANFLDLSTTANQITEARFQDYTNICRHLTSDHYDYIVVLPWIIPGGIDLFAINYIKSIAEITPSAKLLVVLTDNSYQSLTKDQLGFSDSTDIINLPELITASQNYSKTAPDLLYSLIYNLQPQHLHIISNQVGYDCLLKYNDILHERTSLIFSSYNYLISQTGDYLGYHVKELPKAYRPGDIVTTDNQNAKTMLIEKFGFLEQDILIHNQLYDIDITKLSSPTNQDGINILWSAHLRPEKNPDILNQIASNLASRQINIDCYGILDLDSWPDRKIPLNLKQPNLHYCGPYSNFFSDIDLSKYDLFLYTSHTDGMPNVIIEAAIAGLPIVTSDIGGIRDKLGKHAHYIQDTHSADEFTKSILDVLEHHAESLKDAKFLQTEYTAHHSKAVFLDQVKEMLKRKK